MSSPRFRVVNKGQWPDQTAGTLTLVVDMWDDFHFKTAFSLHYGTGDDTTELGMVKIAPRGMTDRDLHTSLPPVFTQLSPEFYSLGQDREYYEALMNLPNNLGPSVLKALRDVADNSDLWAEIQSEPALTTSLLRSVPKQTVAVQFRRIIMGQAPLTPYRFSYNRPLGPTTPELRLEFGVHPDVMPPTNVHVLIGANGVGKSSLLRDFVDAASGSTAASGSFRDEMTSDFSAEKQTVPFANVVHVAFSAFDRESPAPVQTDIDVHAVGLSKANSKTLESQFARSLIVCTKGSRRSRWLRAMETLSTADGILADTDLATLLTSDDAATVFANLSSGHKIVLLTMTRLVELVEERSLVLVDEPETHLHPPLLSALTRAISDLMTDRNGVAIIATHSPVVLQEVPRTCTWMMQRSGEDVRASQLATETFGESVSRLTSEVFHLDINRTGYHHVLRMLLKEHGGSAEQALGAIDGQLGSEGRFLLSALDDSEEPDDV